MIHPEVHREAKRQLKALAKHLRVKERRRASQATITQGMMLRNMVQGSKVVHNLAGKYGGADFGF